MNDALSTLLALDLTSGPLLILTHDNPDPDSLSSACALRYLLKATRGIDAVVGYTGIVGRAENRAMIVTLALDVVAVSDADLPRFSHFALIDAQPDTGNSLLGDDRVVDIVIDHHPLRDATLRARFHDVRSDVGASATILTQYLTAAGLPIDSRLATALFYGIRTETQDLGRETSDHDRQAYHHLFPLADQGMLGAIARPRLSAAYYHALGEAVDDARRVDDVLVCVTGAVPDPDFVPEMADLLVRLEGINWTLVQGEYQGRLYLSIRTQNGDGRAGELMQRILEGYGRGGGHGMRAGGAIELAPGQRAREIGAIIEQRFLESFGRSAPPQPVRHDQAHTLGVGREVR